MDLQPLFLVTSNHKSFNDKQKHLSEELDKVNVIFPEDVNCHSDSTPKRKNLRNFKDKESIFRKPDIPLWKSLRTSKIPDFKKNPHKWIKYSLHDVKEEDTSEAGNKKAAFMFLKELKDRNNIHKMDRMGVPSGKIAFHKSKSVENIKDAEDKPTFQDSKVVMPEYVIGQKIKKEKKVNKSVSYSMTKQLRLSHLVENEED